MITVVMEGFFFVPATGAYNFSTNTSVDNYLAMWHGNTAYSTWNDSNHDYAAIRLKTPYTGGSVALSLTQGAFFPITLIWCNGGGPGTVYYQIAIPNGNTISDTTGYFIPPCVANSTFIP